MPVTPLHLPESVDSDLIQLATIDAPIAKSARTRLRLTWLIAILFGRKIYVSEGWSLDSLAFFQVGNELLKAIDELRGEDPRIDNIDNYSPFVLERRSQGGYVSTFLDYLQRSDCRWSGFPELAKDTDKRGRLIEKIAPLQSGSNRDLRRGFESAFATELDDRVGSWIGAMAEHERRCGKALESQSPHTMHLDFYGSLRGRLQKACTDLRNDEANIISKELGEVIRQADRHRESINSSSQFLRIAKENMSDALHPAINHITRLNYMRWTASHAKASFASPALKAGEDEHSRILQNAIFPESKNPAVEYLAEKDDQDIGFEEISKETDWVPVWKQVIKLAHNPQWQELSGSYTNSFSSAKPSSSQTDAAFKKMERLFAHECPELTLMQSRNERWGLNLTFSKAIEFTAQIAVAAATGTAVTAGAAAASGAAIISVPFLYGGSTVGVGLLAMGGIKAAEDIAKESAYLVRPLTKKSLTTSLLRFIK